MKHNVIKKEFHNIFHYQNNKTHVTLVASHISPAGGAIAAGFIFTVVHLAFAIASSVIGRTFTIVGVPSVDAVTAVVAQFICLDP